MTYVTTAWAYQEVVSSAKLQQMSDNDEYLKAKVDTFISAAYAVHVFTGSFLMTGVTGTFPITIPAGFTVAPHLFPAVDNTNLGTVLQVKATSATAGTAGYYNGANGVSLPYRILAVQMLPGAATG